MECQPALQQSPVKVTGNLLNIAQPYLCAWHIFTTALQRFDELGTPPVAASA